MKLKKVLIFLHAIGILLVLFELVAVPLSGFDVGSTRAAVVNLLYLIVSLIWIFPLYLFLTADDGGYNSFLKYAFLEAVYLFGILSPLLLTLISTSKFIGANLFGGCSSFECVLVSRNLFILAVAHHLIICWSKIRKVLAKPLV
ncbi:hypothetical protein [Persicirhabdus sediminis]|uniref:Uncharacterized protein n=1 Tax=Persicirhabdus sediminis TaxID=454144 RepID=A0A8J7SLQ2_9BACT|nr:hypothetical protein [Persicirhabdus sediminis]MBK1791515.1 hypothetical protein [Persicirhabdus sediminis]